MSRFVDVYLDPCVPGYPCISSPRWSTRIVQVDSGSEQVDQRWAHPLHRFTLPEAVREMPVFNAVRDHWLVMRGPAKTWPWRDPLDFASIPLATPNEQQVPISAGDQEIGIGDGVKTMFELTKLYQRGAQSYTRRIVLPVVSTLLVSIDGTPIASPGNWSVTRPGGLITFVSPPGNGAIVRAGYLFDCIVRFENDASFDGIVRTFGVGGFADLVLLECRSC